MNELLLDDLRLLVGFLLTSAYGLYGEPKGYGPFRLMDAAGRLLAAMEKHGMNDVQLTALREKIDGERFGHSSDAELQAFLNELCLEYARYLAVAFPPEAIFAE